MTPKEKAKELVSKFQKQIFFEVTNERLDIEEAKGCALIAVDEILKAIPSEYLDEWKGETYMSINEDVEYYQKVKQEIQAL
jgi:hypothetical protein